MKSLPERDELWMAYLDGELSAAEAAAFVSNLGASERALTESETRLEAALAARLATGPACPEGTWDQTLALLKGHAAPRPWWRVERPLRVAAIALIALSAWAAAIAMNYQSLFAATSDTSPSFALNIATIDDMLAHAEVRGGQDEVQAFLDQNRLPVSFNIPKPADAAIKSKVPQLLGAGLERYGAVDVPVVYAACCGKPVKVVFVHTCGHTKFGHCSQPGVVNSKRIGDFIAFVVTQHQHAAGLLALLTEKPLRTASAG